MKKIINIGINDYNKNVRFGNKYINSYLVWKSMITRCYDKKYQNKHPTYIGCIVCDEWLYFSNFKKWFDKNYRWDLDSIGIKLDLDKDLLSNKNNKIYSPDTCIFIPQKINKFMTNIKSNNTSGYTGVSWHKYNKKWRVRINDFDNGKTKLLGYFLDINEAKNAYINARKIESIKAKNYLRDLLYSDNIINKIH